MIRLNSLEREGIKVFIATDPQDVNETGIHLFSPTQEDVINAVEDALLKVFPCVIIHSERTWIKRREVK
jgi:hypothetical protein